MPAKHHDTLRERELEVRSPPARLVCPLALQASEVPCVCFWFMRQNAIAQSFLETVS